MHDFSLVFGGRLTADERAAKQMEYPPQRHPVIRTNPETGERGIYTNRAFVSHIEGVTKEESDQILLHLEMAVADPSVQCRVRWEVDTFVMWDNRSTQHHATNDFWPSERQVERVTVVGDRPA
jgi:taurine dioxygenase